jgi:hypothetical protein
VWLLVVPPQNGPGLLIEQVGLGFTVIVLEQILVHPFLVMLSVIVYVPEEPAITDTVAVLDAPSMIPLPSMDQEWLTVPPSGNTVLVWLLVVPPQKGPTLLIEQDGVGFTTTSSTQDVLTALFGYTCDSTIR